MKRRHWATIRLITQHKTRVEKFMDVMTPWDQDGPAELPTTSQGLLYSIGYYKAVLAPAIIRSSIQFSIKAADHNILESSSHINKACWTQLLEGSLNRSEATDRSRTVAVFSELIATPGCLKFQTYLVKHLKPVGQTSQVCLVKHLRLLNYHHSPMNYEQ